MHRQAGERRAERLRGLRQDRRVQRQIRSKRKWKNRVRPLKVGQDQLGQVGVVRVLLEQSTAPRAHRFPDGRPEGRGWEVVMERPERLKDGAAFGLIGPRLLALEAPAREFP